jgi:hypothetical protein
MQLGFEQLPEHRGRLGYDEQFLAACVARYDPHGGTCDHDVLRPVQYIGITIYILIGRVAGSVMLVSWLLFLLKSSLAQNCGSKRDIFTNRLRWFGAMVIHNESGAPLSGEISPYPLQEHAHA